MGEKQWDVIVIGCGNAALCAAASAMEEGADVLVLERAPESKRGGNGIFTAGLVRFAYDGIESIQQLAEIPEEEAATLDVGSYPASRFFDDVASLGDYLADPDVLDALTSGSFPTMLWLKSLGVRFIPSYGMHAKEHEGKIHFRGNAPLEISGGGLGLVEHMVKVVERKGGDIWYSSRAVGLERSEYGWAVSVSQPDAMRTVEARSVVFASGGFEANPSMRAQYLGPGWDLARVRGTEFNTGDGIKLAESVGAALTGNWSCCHATPTDAATPRTGDRVLLHTFTRHSYNFGIMVNREGRRFTDEAENYETHTYARFGREILKQPGGEAVQIFDATGAELVREEYWSGVATRIQADTLPELAEKLGLGETFLETVQSYNDSVLDAPFDPKTLDGKGTQGITPPKSNWAVPIEKPPFYGFPVVCGITFTYGGLKISGDANVLDEEGRELPGLFAAGEIIGGLWYNNYPTATGITTGAVFGRKAGMGAGKHAMSS
jgi:tricarballylate dehydrogenase